MSKKYVASQTIRDYMADHGIEQSMLVERMSVTQPSISYSLKQELSNDTQNRWLKLVDEIYLEEKASTEEGGRIRQTMSARLVERLPSSRLVSTSRFLPRRTRQSWLWASGPVSPSQALCIP